MIDYNPSIKGETIETVYEWYKQNLFLVNRNYQRKLVWTIEEKISFIQTIMRGLPVPLFLLAKKTYLGQEVFEILDGMQRLNAIFSYIEGDFPVDGKYFNLEANASLKIRKDNHELTQNDPILDGVLSARIAGYQLPISTTHFKDDNHIEEAFKRINASGKHLSKQELRQAGTKNMFSQLVRNIAEDIRGDCSDSNFVPLDKMKSISLSNKDLGYGIVMRKIFWAQNSIITVENIRESRDEELIAHILAAIISDNSLTYTSANLDKAYGFAPNNESDIDLENNISRIGNEKIRMQFDFVFAELKKVIESSNKSFKNIMFANTACYVHRVYYVVFLAFYDLLINKEKKILNYKNIANNLSGEGKIFKEENTSNREVRDKLIRKIEGLIEGEFDNRTSTDPILNNWVSKIDHLLREVKSENTGYDFKVGFHVMYNDKFGKPDYDTALETLLSMANKGKSSIGYVFIGIADNEKDAKRHEKFYNCKPPIKVGNYHVVGIDDEAIKSFGNIDEYYQHFQHYIESVEIVPSSYKDYILKNMLCIPYYDKTIIQLQIKGENDPVMYKGKYYHRIGTSTKEVPMESMKSLFRGFL